MRPLLLHLDPMLSLRRIALILASWYFIMPPPVPTRVPPGHPPYLGNWRILRTFDDADACRKFAATLQKNTHEMKARRELARATCISSDDPRMRPEDANPHPAE